jgi:hypothetical protein
MQRLLVRLALVTERLDEAGRLPGRLRLIPPRLRVRQAFPCR